MSVDVRREPLAYLAISSKEVSDIEPLNMVTSVSSGCYEPLAGY